MSGLGHAEFLRISATAGVHLPKPIRSLCSNSTVRSLSLYRCKVTTLRMLVPALAVTAEDGRYPNTDGASIGLTQNGYM